MINIFCGHGNQKWSKCDYCCDINKISIQNIFKYGINISNIISQIETLPSKEISIIESLLSKDLDWMNHTDHTKSIISLLAYKPWCSVQTLTPYLRQPSHKHSSDTLSLVACSCGCCLDQWSQPSVSCMTLDYSAAAQPRYKHQVEFTWHEWGVKP